MLDTKSAERIQLLIQSSPGVVIDVKNSNEAIVRSLMSEFGRQVENDEGFHAVCTYHDEVIKEDGEWKFLTRTLELKYFDELPVPGRLRSINIDEKLQLLNNFRLFQKQN